MELCETFGAVLTITLTSATVHTNYDCSSVELELIAIAIASLRFIKLKMQVKSL